MPGFADDRLQFNGAVFLEEWDDVQIAFQGGNGIVQVGNGPKAEIQGVEAQIDWLPTDALRVSTSLAYYDSELKDDYCVGCNEDGSPWAPAGTPLPVTPDFKANLIARYSYPLGGYDGYVQGAYGYQASRPSIINIADMQPHSEQSHCAARPARFALEMTQGWFAQRGIRAGTSLRGLDKAAQKR